MTKAHPVVAAALQQALVDLTDLSLQGKQAHWNIEGPGFRSLHLHLDEIIDEVRLAADDVAERMAAIEVAPDGRAATVAATSLVDPMEPGFLPTDKTARQYEERLLGVAERIKATLDPVDEHDHLSNDLLTGIATGLEKQAWMLRAAIPATKSKTTTHIGTALSFIIAASLVIFSMITGKATVIWVCILGIPTLVWAIYRRSWLAAVLGLIEVFWIFIVLALGDLIYGSAI